MYAPIQTVQTKHTGRPSISENQYSIWLEELKPYLQAGHSLRHAISKACLDRHKTSIYEKSRLNDWFLDKITTYQSLIGDLVNESYAVLVEEIYAKITSSKDSKISRQDIGILTFLATHHRSTEPFFIRKSKNQNVMIKPVELVSTITYTRTSLSMPTS